MWVENPFISKKYFKKTKKTINRVKKSFYTKKIFIKNQRVIFYEY